MTLLAHDRSKIHQAVLIFLSEVGRPCGMGKIERSVWSKSDHALDKRAIRKELPMMLDLGLIKREMHKGIGNIKVEYYRISAKGQSYIDNL